MQAFKIDSEACGARAGVNPNAQSGLRRTKFMKIYMAFLRRQPEPQLRRFSAIQRDGLSNIR